MSEELEPEGEVGRVLDGSDTLALEADVLVIGGGPAGTWAALAAAAKGARVVLADKGYCGSSGATAPSGVGVWYVPPVPEMREAAKRRDTVAYVEADRAFHVEMVAAAGNDILTSLYVSLRDRQLRMGVVNLLDTGAEHGDGVDTARMRKSADEHERITEAIASRSLRAVDAAVEAHLDDASRLLSRRR